jgi:hypothetical protein
VVIERFETVYDDDGDRPPPAYRDAPAEQGSAPPACGRWSWNAGTDDYDWIPC